MSIKFSTGAVAAILSTGSLKGVFENGVLYCYSGSQPSDADSAETGDTIAVVTVDGGAFTPGASTNGLNFDSTTSTTISKASAETWEGTYLADGALGWFRFYSNSKTTGASTTAIRFDGSIGVSRGDLKVTTTTAQTGGKMSVTKFDMDFSVLG